MIRAFPGGTSVTHLSVYSGLCPDGLAGGTPHLHTASTEAYVVVGGSGALRTLDPSGLRETPLQPGSVVWFTPGTIHRAVNRGGLTVVVVMANAGLPEAGDAVMTFPPEIVADPDRYARAATLPSGEPEAVLDNAARRRRDLAVEGFERLVEATESGDPAPLERFYDDAASLVRPRIAQWRRIWQRNVAAQTAHTADILDALERGDGRHLRAAALLQAPPSATAGFGMCGRLRTYDVRNPLGGEDPP
ncbi:cupin domain-containing protein [Phytohabitans sp. ZYX-F-186]|uniref:Cupin domain-containing protein n=1 Tax=Phytohabitans maris TaxID=3071409 RepID=A0ABU0ZSA0_9ACTN|nr:cupin domain-containing protein [Phytohabitans sp. ZYX-F-186]MDQ7909899.1 cupin domain-containing protein [Phytohabitans sp. ZYX-F-186]